MVLHLSVYALAAQLTPDAMFVYAHAPWLTPDAMLVYALALRLTPDATRHAYTSVVYLRQMEVISSKTLAR